MKNLLLSSIFILLLCNAVSSQTTDLQIKILTEKENEPLMGATVFFKNLQKGAVTNFDGIAEFTKIVI